MTQTIKPAIQASNVDEGHRTRPAPFGHALVEKARNNDKIVGMSADLSKYTDMHIFAEAFPDRFYQMGMSEQLMATAAGGFAKEGFNPFISTYATFAARRCYDFMSQAVAEQDANVKLIGGLPGLTTGYGPSHQATDDLAIYRAMPNITVIDPCDAVEIEQMVPAMVAHQGPICSRILRGAVPVVLDEYDYSFEMGKAKLLRGGNDVLIISTGFMTMRALDAAKELQKDGVDVAVLHVPVIKPLDEETIRREAAKTGRLVVIAENHSCIGGLGEAVATSLIFGGVHASLRQIALPDQFLDAGTLPVLQDRYGISRAAVCEQIPGVALMDKKFVLITGGASGIGRGVAELAISKGWHVAIFDLPGSNLDEVGEALPSDMTSTHAVDICDEAAVAAALEDATAQHGPLKGVVNCAGIAENIKFYDVDVDRFRKILDVNVIGSFIVSHAAAQKMDSGSIVNISSVSGVVGTAGRTAYGASKGAVNTMTKVMATELANKGIRVNAIAPGPVETPMALKWHDAETRSSWTTRVPLGRYGSVQEIAAPIVALLDDETSSYVTGQILAVDGGFVSAGLP